MPVTDITPAFPWNVDGGVTPAWIDGSIPLTVTVDDGIENYDYVNVELTDNDEGVTLPTYRAAIESITSANVGIFRFRLGQIIPSFWGNIFPKPTDIVGSDYESSIWAKDISFRFFLGGYTNTPDQFNKYYFGSAQYYGYQRYKIGNNVADNLKIISEDNNTFWIPLESAFQSLVSVPFQVVGNQTNGLVNEFTDGEAYPVPLDDNLQIYYANILEGEYNFADYTTGLSIFEARTGASLETLFYSLNVNFYSACPDDLLVRYFDRQGMLRFVAFNNKFQINEDPEEIGRYENVDVGSPAMADSDQFSVGYDTIRSFTCVRDNVEEAELKYLAQMKSSRFVQYYDNEKEDWVRIFPQPQTFRIRGGTGDFSTITISFDLPTVVNLNLL